MRHAKQSVVSPRWLHGALAAFAALVLGCSAQVGTHVGPGTGNTGAGGTTGPGSGGTVGGGGATGSGGTTVPVVNCTPADATNVIAPQRVVRLTLQEVVNSLAVLFAGAPAVPVVPATTPATTQTIAAAVQNKFMIGDPTTVTFPPLNSTREGVTIIADRWATLDQIASTVGQYVFDNFAAVTKCTGTTLTDACAQTYLAGLAAAAFRRPLDTAPATGETTRLMGLYTTLRAPAIAATIQEATQNGVYGILSAPQFLYRSEIGNRTTTSTTMPGIALTPYEVASQLSFFLTDAPPDTMLLAAARDGSLANAATVTTQFNRLIATPAVQTNLSTAMFVLYKLNLLDNVVIDSTKFPDYTVGLKNAMYTESDMFLKSVLWGAGSKLSDLLTSSTTFINSDLATKIYNIPVPAGATVTSFVKATLPAATRSGLISQAGFITSRARPGATSVVARGLAIQETMLCGSTPPPPMDATTKAAIGANLSSPDTEKVKANFRDTTQPCMSCHGNFDAFGLVMENYDAIGRYRTADDMSRPIDPTASLPATVTGTVTPVMNAVDFAQTLGSSPGFVNCMSKNMLQYALSDVTSAPVPLGGCAVQAVSKAYTANTDKSFTEMVREVALSNAVTRRNLTQ